MTSIPSDRFLVIKDPSCPAAEHFRTLRANLASRLKERDGWSICVTSSWPREGKSLIAANLAACFGLTLPGVVLVDGDLRRPQLTRVLGQTGQPGLGNLLESASGLASAYLHKTSAGLYFLPAGTSTQNPANLMAGEPMSRVVQELRHSGHSLLWDAPPLSVCSDPLLIGAHCDGVLLVVSSQSWRGEEELDYKSELEAHNIPILGVALNQTVEKEEARYYSHYYGKS